MRFLHGKLVTSALLAIAIVASGFIMTLVQRAGGLSGSVSKVINLYGDGIGWPFLLVKWLGLAGPGAPEVTQRPGALFGIALIVAFWTATIHGGRLMCARARNRK